ncbi:GNAT family N-acetyltransferase [Anaerococcus sp. AGMB00486]|uniref:GNAT family N-acetyltransferase n=2 Tax=Anaerococcus TaxID=165779 RepID=A0ABX2N9I2_9FIRM|nr:MULTISPECIES: GNAT family protein [Anaerococcus]MDY3006399.1 GNAT family protein [Anaerococcus porci]MSS78478.1 GNAT family N-acetyltransferase [Anaerococcus porci]NVF11334.1 GNAT family N-acetyltransferase [Anaerococcus faecalis]
MEIIGKDEEIYLKEIDIDDAFDLRYWKLFEDERLRGYNYGNFTEIDSEIWYRNVKGFRKKYFAVRRIKDDRFIAFIGLKDINKIIKKSVLGIVFDPAFTSKGYGFKAMTILLDYYFNDMKFYELYLEVNDFNVRAKKLYEKLGFKKIGTSFEVFENQDVEIDGEFFVKRYNKVYSKISQMRIRKGER